MEMRGGSEWGVVGEDTALNEIWRRLDALSEKKDEKNSASDDLGIADGSAAVWLWWNREFILFRCKLGL